MNRLTRFAPLALLIASTGAWAEIELPAGNLHIESVIPASQVNNGATGRTVLAVDPVSIYSNVTNFAGQAYAQGPAVAGITRMVMDDLTFATDTGVSNVSAIRFAVANLNATAQSVRARVRFWNADGPSLGAGLPNGPGSYYAPGGIPQGYSFNAFTFAPGVTTLTANLGAGFPVPANATTTLWAGIAFDNVGTTTAATNTELNNFGQAFFTPVDRGTSANIMYQTTAAGSFFPTPSPAGAGITFGTTTANVGWEFVVTNLGNTDLSVTKTDGLTTAIAGTTAIYTVVASNNGPTGIVGATVADTFPASCVSPTWSCVGATGGTCPANGAGNISALVNLPAGATATFTALCPIAAAATGSLANTATITLPTGYTDTVPANDSATDTDTLGSQADLSMTLTDAPDPVTAGTQLTYTATLTNIGPSDATDASFSLPLPAGTAFVSAAPSAAGTCTGTGPVVCTWTGATAPAGLRSAIITVAVPAPQTAALSATATASSLTTDPAPANDTATATTAVAVSSDLSITLTDAPDPVTAGTSLTYTATITNAGPSDAAGVTITLPLPTGTSLVSGAVSGGGTCAGSPVVCSVTGSVAPGASRTATIVVAVSAAVLDNTVLTATATVGGAPDPNAANNSATTTTTVITTADLLLGFTASATQVLVNVPVTFTATSLNQGPSDAQDLAITITLTPDFRFSSLTATGATCTTPQVGTTGAIVCTWAGATAPGVTRTLVVVAYGNTEGTAAVNASTHSSTPDPVANNNLGNLSVVVGYLTQEIPASNHLGLILLGLMLGLIGIVAVRRQA